jgi:hypothetical protein
MYFSGNDVRILMNGNELDCNSIQFTLNQSTTPAYSSSSSKMITQMIGTKIIYGALSLNYREAYSLERYMRNAKNGISSIEIQYDRTEPVRDRHPSVGARTKNGTYKMKNSVTNYTLYDVHITGKEHSVGPSPENVVENFQFIAKDFVAYEPKSSYI